jgi:hypothetical protein
MAPPFQRSRRPRLLLQFAPKGDEGHRPDRPGGSIARAGRALLRAPNERPDPPTCDQGATSSGLENSAQI